MLDIQRIRENPEAIRRAMENKGMTVDIDLLLQLDSQRRALQYESDQLKNLRNRRSAEVVRLKKENKDVSAIIAEMKQVSDRTKELDGQLREVEERLRQIAAQLPNIPHPSVPHGYSAKENVVVSQWGEERTFDFEPLDHLAIGEKLGLFDFPRGAKISGTGFPVYTGDGALLERALISFMLDTHVCKNGYREIWPPFLVNATSAFGTGQLPKSAEQMYYVSQDDLYCIPTAEVPVTNLFRDEIFDESQLPLKLCAYSACFRREAGSYGKDVRGFLRVHQFNKVELVKFVAPHHSYDELETLRRDAEEIVQALGLTYRVVALCDADLSFAAAKCYDIEVWAPVEKKFLEVSSCSNFEDFQARRMNTRYRPAGGGKLEFVHTLNGSGLATSRIMVALLETHQTSAGTVKIPEALWPYMHGKKEIGAN